MSTTTQTNTKIKAAAAAGRSTVVVSALQAGAPPRAFYSSRTIALTTSISVAYMLLSYFLIGFNGAQVFIVTFCNAMFYASRTTRQFMKGFVIFVFYWIVFDYMKAFPNYKTGTVHIESLYHLEQRLFGITTAAGVMTPNEYFLQHQSSIADFLFGFSYLLWIPLPLAFAGYLFAKKRTAFFHFSLTFILVNWIGYSIYYLYPAAPPWYAEMYGFTFNPATPGEVAGLGRFDTITGLPVFTALYKQSSNVFAAMPSPHSAYPLIVLWFGLKHRLGWWNVLFALVCIGIWVGAVYTSHHYVLDVLMGILCTVAGVLLFQWMLRSTRWLNVFITRWMNA